jgi:hypothetical protein
MQASIRRAIDAARAGTLPDLHFLDVDSRVIERELGRGRWRASGA